MINTTDMTIGFRDIEGGPNVAENLGLAGSGRALVGGLNLQIGDTADHFNIISVSVNDMGTRGLGLMGMNIASYDAATSAVGLQAEQGRPGTIKGAINLVSAQRASLGALQNRLEHTINNLGVTTENLTAAESRIRDTDMAKEMMEYTKNNILVQAAQAMLAQANQVPQGVLQLLR
jgi:flagellin